MKKPLPRIFSVLPSSMVDTALEELQPFSHLRDECLNLEYFHTLEEARVIIGERVNEYNHIRPHSSLGYTPPAPLVMLNHKGYALTYYSAI